MELELDLTGVPGEYHLAFCQYIIDSLIDMITKSGELPQYSLMEQYINSNNIIDWQIKNNNFISVFDLYRLIANNLQSKKIDENTYCIYINPNENIPNAYTLVITVASLLEYGTLSIRKCGILTHYMQVIADEISTYYKAFLMEVSE